MILSGVLNALETRHSTTAGLFAVGSLVPLVNGPIQAVLQATVAPEFQGRVFTLYMSACGAMAPLGLLIAAPIAELAGVRALYTAGGLACLAMGIGGFLVPSIKTIEDDVVEPEEAETAVAA